MKKLFYNFPVVPIAIGIGIAILASCKSGSTTSADAKKDSVVMPYTAIFTKTWVLSDSSKYAQTVLQSIKDWEDNKLSNGKTYYADTVAFDHWSGMKFKGKRDSLLKIFQTVRDSFSSVKIDMYTWLNSYTPDKKENWVGTWYKETDTYKNGKVDSAFYHDENLVKDGKIVYTMDQRRNLPKGK